MAKAEHFKRVSRSRQILLNIWIASLTILIVTYIVVLIYPGKVPLRCQIPVFCMAYLAAGLFFSITTSSIIQKIRERDVITPLWDFSSECARAGLLGFYATRESKAKAGLLERFESHKGGAILMTGPSLRVFLAHGYDFYSTIQDNIPQYKSSGVKIRIVNCDMNANRCLPIRSYIEEFNPDGKHPGGNPRKQLPWQSEDFNWEDTIYDSCKFDVESFLKEFYKNYGENGKRYKCRCVVDLEDVQKGIDALNAKAKEALITARTTSFAPYFTAVIFPDVCYYTPNLLYSEPPANMPMLTFWGGTPVYNKILMHFKFLWLSGKIIRIGESIQNEKRM